MHSRICKLSKFISMQFFSLHSRFCSQNTEKQRRDVFIRHSSTILVLLSSWALTKQELLFLNYSKCSFSTQKATEFSQPPSTQEAHIRASFAGKHRERKVVFPPKSLTAESSFFLNKRWNIGEQIYLSFVYETTHYGLPALKLLIYSLEDPLTWLTRLSKPN